METKKYKHFETYIFNCKTMDGKEIIGESICVKSRYTGERFLTDRKHLNVLKIIDNIFTTKELVYIRDYVKGSYYLFNSAFWKYAEFVKMENRYNKVAAFSKEDKEKIEKVLQKRHAEFMEKYGEAMQEHERRHKIREEKDDHNKRMNELIGKWNNNKYYTVTDIIRDTIKTGANEGELLLETNCKENRLLFRCDYERYSSGCKYTKSVYNFTIEVKRGWSVHNVAGVMTFVPGYKIKRDGLKCEWIEEDRSIGSVYKVSGYLVRGEHIEAKSLTAAKKISAQHRAKIMNNLLKLRRKQNAILAATMQQYRELARKWGVRLRLKTRSLLEIAMQVQLTLKTKLRAIYSMKSRG